ncbi:MAG: Hsp20/alpha crystallin family protein [Anaerolineaceae bacterium]|nr:Hsp20/alpha crystallin family protein [Anaerolineaceae bacterium]
MTIYLQRPYHGSRMRRRFTHSPVNTQVSNTEKKLFFPVDIKVEEESYLISAILPGVQVEDLDIEITQELVTISGEIHKEQLEEDHYLVQERAAGQFSRSFKLPIPLDADKAKAELKDGILKLHIPKSEQAKPRSIKISKN